MIKINKELLTKQNVVILAADYDLRKNMGPSNNTVNNIYNIVKKLCNHVELVNDYKTFINEYNKYSNFIVFQLSSPFEDSYYENTFLPLFCEVNNIKFVNNHSYFNFYMSDKEFLKIFCNEYELNTPFYTSFAPEDFNSKKRAASNVGFPAMFKRSLSTESKDLYYVKSIVHLEEIISALPEEMMKEKFLLEKFIDGDDINISIFGKNGEIDLIFENTEFIHSSVPQEERFLSNELKQHSKHLRFKKCSNRLSDDDRRKIRHLYHDLKHVKYMRLDCRIDNSTNTLYILEGNSLPSISEKSSCYMGFKEDGYTYEDFIAYLLINSID